MAAGAKAELEASSASTERRKVLPHSVARVPTLRFSRAPACFVPEASVCASVTGEGVCERVSPSAGVGAPGGSDGR